MNDNVVERIKKLLRLAQSSNPHEAELALARAFEIAARHRIEIAELDVEDADEELIHRSFPIGLRISFLKRKALGIVIAFFNVNGVCRGDQITFVGTEADVTIAWYVFELIVGEAKRRLQDFETAERSESRRSTKKKRDSFTAGFIYGIAHQLGRRRESMTIEDSRFAIVLADQERARQGYVDSLCPDLGPPRRQRNIKDPNKTALLYGFQCGRATKINKPLAGSRPETLALTW